MKPIPSMGRVVGWAFVVGIAVGAALNELGDALL